MSSNSLFQLFQAWSKTKGGSRGGDITSGSKVPGLCRSGRDFEQGGGLGRCLLIIIIIIIMIIITIIIIIIIIRRGSGALLVTESQNSPLLSPVSNLQSARGWRLRLCEFPTYWKDVSKIKMILSFEEV